MRTVIKNRELIENRRDQIGECALHIFAKNGYDRTTVEAIANACRLGVGSVYRYVGNKQDILFLAIESFLNKAQVLAVNAQNYSELLPPEEAIKNILKELFEFYDMYRDFTMFVYHEMRNLLEKHRNWCFDIEEKIIDSIEQALRKGFEDGVFHSNNFRVSAHNILVLAEMWAVRGWFLKKQQSLEEHIRHQTDFILDGIRSNSSSSGTS